MAEKRCHGSNKLLPSAVSSSDFAVGAHWSEQASQKNNESTAKTIRDALITSGEPLVDVNDLHKAADDMDLRSDIDALRRKLESLVQKQEDADVVRRGQLDCISERIYQAEKNLRHSEETQHDAIEKASATFQKHARDTAQDRQNLHRVIDQVNQNFEQVSSEIATNTQTVGTFEQAIQQMQATVEQMSHDVRTCSASVASLSHDFSALESEVQEIQLRFQESQILEHTVQRQQLQINDTQVTVQAMHDAVMQMTPQTQFAEAEVRNRGFSDQIEELRAFHNNISEQFSQITQQISRLQEEAYHNNISEQFSQITQQISLLQEEVTKVHLEPRLEASPPLMKEIAPSEGQMDPGQYGWSQSSHQSRNRSQSRRFRTQTETQQGSSATRGSRSMMMAPMLGGHSEGFGMQQVLDHGDLQGSRDWHDSVKVQDILQGGQVGMADVGPPAPESYPFTALNFEITHGNTISQRQSVDHGFQRYEYGGDSVPSQNTWMTTTSMFDVATEDKNQDVQRAHTSSRGLLSSIDLDSNGRKDDRAELVSSQEMFDVDQGDYTHELHGRSRLDSGYSRQQGSQMASRNNWQYVPDPTALPSNILDRKSVV